MFKKNILIVLIFILFSIFPLASRATTLLSDDFTGTTIDTTKWTEIDPSGTVSQNGNITISGSYVGATWGVAGLDSKNTFSRTGLSVSANMSGGSAQLLGYGDRNFQSLGTAAYILDIAAGSTYALAWNNGTMDGGSNMACGAPTANAKYTITPTPTGFSVYKDTGGGNVLMCSAIVNTSITNKGVFLSSENSATFDNVLVTGTSNNSAPDAPTSLTATAGNTQVALSWTAPVNNGGSVITDYLVEYKLNSEPTTWTTFNDGTSTSTSVAVTSLSNESVYNFRVSAVNAIGTSSPSSTANATPSVPTTPGAPTNLSGVSGNNQISLSWVAASTGGSAITDYLVEYKLNSEPTTWTTFNDGTSASTSAIVTSLTNDLLYNFRVSAVNAIGTSSPSSTANAMPGQPIPLTISNLSFWLDGSDLSSITESGGLISQVNDKSGNNKNGLASNSLRPTLVSNVQNGRPVMRFDGTDDYLNINSSVTYRTIFVVAKSDDTPFSNYPGIIGDFTGTSPVNGHILNGIDGTTKLGTGASSFTSAYRNGTLVPAATGHNFSPLNEFWIGSFELPSDMTNTTSAIGMVNGGARYWDGDIAEVIVYNSVLGNEDRALVENYLSAKWGIAVDGPTTPGTPTGLGASKGNTQISLSWTAPGDNGGSSITDYIVEYKLSSEPTTWTTFVDGNSTSTTATVTGLTNDLSYDFRVKAVNAFGTSSASSTATKTPGAPTAPDAPTIGTATTGNTQATVAFSAPADNGGSAITSYTVTSSPSGVTASGANSPIIVTGLTNGTEYTFTVTATNAIGTSSASASSNTITPSLLGNQLVDDFTGTTINTIKWLEIDPYGKGGTSGKITQNGTLSVADSYVSAWGTNALISQDSFSATDLEISGVMNTASSPLIGYGDYNFGISGTKVYLLYAQQGSTVLALSWDGASSSQTSCGTATSGANFKMKIVSGGFEVYKNDVLQCTHTNSVVIDNKPIFLEVSASASTFDNILVYGTKSTAIAPGQATGLSSTGMNKQVLLNWDAPVSNGYAVVSDYLIEYKLSSASSWSTFSDGTSQNTKAVVTGLTNGLAYNFRVSAINSFGAGTASATSSATPNEIDNLIFVITGESNSGGIGSNGSATAGEVAPRSSVQILELTSGNFLFEDLDIGTNNLRDHSGLESYYNTSHGLELGLANNTEANTFPDNPQVHLIKTGHGGSQVGQWNYAGTYFTKFLQRTAAAKTQLDEDRKWVVWMSIGINDGISGTNIVTFKNNIKTYIDNIKADLPGAIILMTQFQSMPANSGYPIINSALADVASEEANVYVVDTTSATGTDGANHWTYSGLKTVASLMTTTAKNALGLNYPGKVTGLEATPSGTSVGLSWTAPISNGGSAITDYLIEYKTTAGSTWSTFNDGVSTSATTSVTGLIGGTLYNFRVSAINSNGAGNTLNINSTTTDADEPTISAVSSTPSDTSVIITWTTDEASSSKINYGLTDSYGTSTDETDADTRVLSHSVALSNLSSCTTYHFRVRSKDVATNEVVGSDATFTTTGCTGSGEVLNTIVEQITTLSGGTLILDGGASNGLTLTIPPAFTGIDANFQAQQLNSNNVLAVIQTPTGYNPVGTFLYELKALTGISTTISTFDTPITLTFSYESSDIAGLDPSTLKIYRWNGTTWNQLNSCSVNTEAKTVSCTTVQFSTFGLFGVPRVEASSRATGSGIHYGCKDPKALNYEYFASSNPTLCKYAKEIIKTKFNRNLKYGMTGEDVKALQQYLNTNGFIVAKTGVGSLGKETTKFGPATRSALIKFQLANKLKGDGIVGFVTRSVISNLK